MLKKKEETASLAHTKWNCKYHIAFAPKYRRQTIYGQIKSDIGTILRKLCEYKGVEILEAEACLDHIHKHMRQPPKHLGHKQVSTTEDYYAHMIDAKKAQALECITDALLMQNNKGII